MYSQEDGFISLIHALNESGALPHVMIIGSWAEYLYSKTHVVDYDFSFKTQDIDIFLPNIRHPLNKINLSSFLDDRGFKALFQGNGLIKFNYYGVLEVEFLARELGKGQLEPYNTNLSIPAQGLRDTNIFLFSCTSTDYEGCKINIPAPEAYIIHKLVINVDRSPLKIEKDINAIQRLFAVCSENRKHFHRAFLDVLASLTKKQKKNLDITLQSFPDKLYNIAMFLQKNKDFGKSL